MFFFYPEIKCNGMTSFMDFMNFGERGSLAVYSAGSGGEWTLRCLHISSVRGSLPQASWGRVTFFHKPFLCKLVDCFSTFLPPSFTRTAWQYLNTFLRHLCMSAFSIFFQTKTWQCYEGEHGFHNNPSCFDSNKAPPEMTQLTNYN